MKKPQIVKILSPVSLNVLDAVKEIMSSSTVKQYRVSSGSVFAVNWLQMGFRSIIEPFFSLIDLPKWTIWVPICRVCFMLTSRLTIPLFLPMLLKLSALFCDFELRFVSSDNSHSRIFQSLQFFRYVILLTNQSSIVLTSSFLIHFPLVPADQLTSTTFKMKLVLSLSLPKKIWRARIFLKKIWYQLAQASKMHE